MSRATPLLAALCFAIGCAGPASPPPGRAITFPTTDGVTLEGELRGSGKVAVVLAPGYREERSAWAEFAGLLADRGYRVLAFDFRGTGGSEGEVDVTGAPTDLSAAVAEVRARGAERVFVVGAGIGGAAALIAAPDEEVPLAGIVALSAPASFLGLEVATIGSVDEPKLFFAAEGDGTAQATAQMLYDASPPPKRVEVLVGTDNGVEILEGREAEKVRMLILGFLEGYSGP